MACPGSAGKGGLGEFKREGRWMGKRKDTQDETTQNITCHGLRKKE
ncbi:MAG: hypothetical protein ACJZ45_01785 [Nitrospinia bacterium]